MKERRASPRVDLLGENGVSETSFNLLALFIALKGFFEQSRLSDEGAVGAEAIPIPFPSGIPLIWVHFEVP